MNPYKLAVYLRTIHAGKCTDDNVDIHEIYVALLSLDFLYHKLLSYNVRRKNTHQKLVGGRRR